MRLDPFLTKACRYARSGKCDAAIRALEPEASRYHGSFNYYYILGSACLRKEDYGGALTYFRAAHDAKSRNPLAILGLAVLFLRRGEVKRALDCYLDALEISPKSRIAARAMKIIQKRSKSDSLSNWLESGRLPSLYPPMPFPGFSAKEILGVFAMLLALCIIALGVMIRFKMVTNPLYPRGAREGAAAFSLSREERMAPVQTGGSYRYILTRVQALDTYEKAHSLFAAYRDEAARIQLNRILESNAADEIKNRAQIIISYMETPGFDTFRRGDNMSYGEVMGDPALYRGVHVIWRGMATNVQTSDSGTTFDFLVGYDTRKTLEGIAPVAFSHAIPLNPERPLELLCRIVPESPEGPIRLEGVAIHQSGNL